MRIDDPGFDRHALVGEVGGQDLCHARQADHDAPVMGERAARKPGARTSANERDVMPRADADYHL